jgi:hypothetical protein
MEGREMKPDTIGIVVIFIAFMVAVIYGSTGESYPPPKMSEKEVYFLRVPTSSAISP